MSAQTYITPAPYNNYAVTGGDGRQYVGDYIRGNPDGSYHTGDAYYFIIKYSISHGCISPEMTLKEYENTMIVDLNSNGIMPDRESFRWEIDYHDKNLNNKVFEAIHPKHPPLWGTLDQQRRAEMIDRSTRSGDIMDQFYGQHCSNTPDEQKFHGINNNNNNLLVSGTYCIWGRAEILAGPAYQKCQEFDWNEVGLAGFETKALTPTASNPKKHKYDSSHIPSVMYGSNTTHQHIGSAELDALKEGQPWVGGSTRGLVVVDTQHPLNFKNMILGLNSTHIPFSLGGLYAPNPAKSQQYREELTFYNGHAGMLLPATHWVQKISQAGSDTIFIDHWDTPDPPAYHDIKKLHVHDWGNFRNLMDLDLKHGEMICSDSYSGMGLDMRAKYQTHCSSKDGGPPTHCFKPQKYSKEIDPVVHDPTFTVRYAYPPQLDRDALDAKNRDGTYYMDDPVAIVHWPDIPWKEERWPLIRFTTDDRTLSLPHHYSHECDLPRCKINTAFEDFYEIRPDGSTRTILDKQPNTTSTTHRNMYKLNPLEYINGYGSDIVASNNTMHGIGNYSHNYTVSAYNLGDWMFTNSSADSVLVVQYDPIISDMQSWSSLRDAEKATPYNRYALALKYEGSVGGGDDVSDPHPINTTNTITTPDGEQHAIHETRRMKITDILHLSRLSNNIFEPISDWIPNVQTSQADVIQNMTMLASVRDQIPARFGNITNTGYMGHVEMSPIENNTVIMVPENGYLRILQKASLPEDLLEKNYVNITMYDTLASLDFAAKDTYVRSHEYDFPFGFFSTQFNVTAYKYVHINNSTLHCAGWGGGGTNNHNHNTTNNTHNNNTHNNNTHNNNTHNNNTMPCSPADTTTGIIDYTTHIRSIDVEEGEPRSLSQNGSGSSSSSNNTNRGAASSNGTVTPATDERTWIPITEYFLQRHLLTNVTEPFSYMFLTDLYDMNVKHTYDDDTANSSVVMLVNKTGLSIELEFYNTIINTTQSIIPSANASVAEVLIPIPEIGVEENGTRTNHTDSVIGILDDVYENLTLLQRDDIFLLDEVHFGADESWYDAVITAVRDDGGAAASSVVDGGTILTSGNTGSSGDTTLTTPTPTSTTEKTHTIALGFVSFGLPISHNLNMYPNNTLDLTRGEHVIILEGNKWFGYSYNATIDGVSLTQADMECNGGTCMYTSDEETIDVSTTNAWGGKSYKMGVQRQAPLEDNREEQKELFAYRVLYIVAALLAIYFGYVLVRKFYDGRR